MTDYERLTHAHIALMRKRPIHDVVASFIAAQWYGPREPGLTTLTGCGEIIDDVTSEIAVALRDYAGSSSVDDRWNTWQLEALARYVKHHGNRPEQPDWDDRTGDEQWSNLPVLFRDGEPADLTETDIPEIESGEWDVETIAWQYLRTALWAETSDDYGTPLDESYTVRDFGDEYDVAYAVALAFIIANGGDASVCGFDETDVGHNLWLARNGAGIGFDDRVPHDGPQNVKDAAGRLDNAARALGESSVYVGDDGRLYLWDESDAAKGVCQ